MILNKVQFIETINDMMETDDFNTEFNLSVLKYNGDGESYFPNSNLALLKVLQTIFNDTEDWIAHFCWENNYGRRPNSMFKDAGALYDFLIKNMTKGVDSNE